MSGWRESISKNPRLLRQLEQFAAEALAMTSGLSGGGDVELFTAVGSDHRPVYCAADHCGRGELPQRIAWPTRPSRTGYSLSRGNPPAFRDDPSNWTATVLKLDIVTAATDHVQLTFSTKPGRRYQVQFSQQPSSAGWKAIQEINPVRSGVMQFEQTLTTNTAGFYRLSVLPPL
jgi:hypothetical protein